MKLARKSCLVVLTAVVAVLFLSWSYVFNVRPIGHLGDVIAFRFYDSVDRPIATNITSFGVSERTADGMWKPVWSLTGKARLNEVTYGGKYRGLTETVAPKKLVAGKVYGAFASEGSGGSAGRYFRFNADGTMVFPNSPD
jgi:hypothetical protein